jgi:hypothetical protein
MPTGDKTIPLNVTFADIVFGSAAASPTVNAKIKAIYDSVARASLYVVADIMALGALAAGQVQDGERVYVRGFGLYEYRAASTETVAGFWVINGPAGAGRYIHALFDVLGENNGIATLDNNGLLVEPTPNHTVKVGGWSAVAGAAGYVSATYAHLATTLVALGTLQVGDIVQGGFALAYSATGEQAFIRAAVHQNGAPGTASAASRELVAPVGIAGEDTTPIYFVVTTAGAAHISIQRRTDTGAGSVDIDNGIWGWFTVTRP